MPMTDSVSRKRIKGLVTLTLVAPDGTITFQRNNIVTNKGYEAMSRWAAQGPDYPDTISAIAIGEGGHLPGDPTIPLPPSESDTALEEEISRKNIGTATNPGDTEVEFQTVFLTTEGNGEITEAGLFTSNGNMFARTTFSRVVKSGTNLIVTWKITF